MRARPGVSQLPFAGVAVRTLVVVAACSLSACAAARAPHATVASVAAAHTLPPRARLAAQLIARCDTAVAEDRYDAVVQCLAELAELYTPAEYAEAVFPRGLERAAEYLVREGSPRGDEGRVLSGLLIEHLLHPDDEQIVERYERLVYWSFDARADMIGPFERFQGLVEAWQEHARLSPTPAVLSTLARLQLEQRDALVQLFRPSDERVPASATAY